MICEVENENKAAQRAVRFINNLTHTKGRWAGKPFQLRSWQESIIRTLFGTLKPDGFRQFRTLFGFFPRKNGKSDLAAAIALYCLLSEPEFGGEIYSAAADRDQASLVFNVAAAMVRNDPELSSVCKIIDSQKRIVNPRTGSFYRAISSESHTKHGYDASVVIVDEIHALPNRELWDVLSTSMGSREQPLTIAITTAGYGKESLAYELYDYAIKVRDGVIDDPTFLPVLYAAPADADWLDEDVWHAANPALGDFRSIDEMRIKAKEAQEITTRENAFRRLYLNQWTESDIRWIPMDHWDSCGETPINPSDLEGCPCWGGLDLSSTTDVSSFVLVFRENDKFQVLCWHWIPQENAERRERRDRVPYLTWANKGLLEMTPGNSIEYPFIRKKINELNEAFDIRQICVDRWNATQIVTELSGDGFDIAMHGQGYASMSAPSKELERLILGEKLQHGGNPVLRWMASNVTVESDAAGNIKPSKNKSTERIDGIVGLVMAISSATSAEQNLESVYKTRGFLWVGDDE